MSFYLPDRAGDFLDRSGARKSWSKLPISSKSELFEFSKTQFYFSLTFLDENWNNVSFVRTCRFVKSGWNLSRKTRLEIWNPVHRISSKSEQWGSSYVHFDLFIGWFFKSGWNLSRKTRLEIWISVHRKSLK